MKIPIEKAIEDHEKLLRMHMLNPKQKEMIRNNLHTLKELKKNHVKFIEVNSNVS